MRQVGRQLVENERRRREVMRAARQAVMDFTAAVGAVGVSESALRELDLARVRQIVAELERCKLAIGELLGEYDELSAAAGE